MKKKRILALLMSCVMAASTMVPVALADETTDPGYTETNPYVLSFNGGDVPASYQKYATDLFYVTPHHMRLYCTSNNKTSFYGDANACVFNLIDTSAITNEEATSPYASILTYCVDMVTGTVNNSSYQRMNLEDSGHFDDTTAAKLRAIMLNGFPYHTVDDLRNTLNLPTLTGAEAVIAMQYAIWMNANKDTDLNPAYKYPVLLDQKESVPYYKTLKETDEGYPYYIGVYEDSVLSKNSPVNWLEVASEDTAANVTAFAEYLMALTPVEAKKVTVTDAALQNFNVTYQQDAETGACTAVISVEANVEVDEGDELVLTAIIGSEKQNLALTKSGTYTFTFEGCSREVDVSVEINGYQTGGDVYLFEPVGGRDASQDMIGYDKSKLTVHAEVSTSPERVLHIYKYTPTSDKDVAGDGTVTQVTDRTPLANVQFDIYEVCTLNEYLGGKVKLSSVPTEDEIALYQTNANYVGTMTTNQNGYAAFDFGHGKNDGVYMVVEKANSSIKTPVAPFYLCVPMTNPTGDGWLYDIYVYPKNDVITGPEIMKDITKIDNDHDTFDIGEAHTWIVRTTIPADIADAMEYIITDEIDSRLDYVGNVNVKVESTTSNISTPVVLNAETDYVVTTIKNSDESRVEKFTVQLTEAGLKAVADAAPDANYEIRVYFDTKINTSAGLDEEITNQAHLDYTNSVGYEYNVDSDKPEVHTGGTNLVKVDGNSAKDENGIVTYENKLAGATFKIARSVAQGETPDVTMTVGGASVDLKYVDFYANGKRDAKVSEFTTSSDGKASFEGLAYGTYYLVETKAPDGYNLLAEPVSITIEKGTCNEAAAIAVENYSGFEMPETGGIGTTLYTVTGMLLICTAGAFLILSKKRRVF